MPKERSELSRLPNIGATIEKRLDEIGVQTEADLRALGPVNAYKRIRKAHPEITIPVCYYLYSLEGALAGVHWDSLPPDVKEKLCRDAGVTPRRPVRSPP